MRCGIAKGKIVRRVKKSLKSEDVSLRTFRPMVVKKFLKKHPEISKQIVALRIPIDEVVEIFAGAEAGTKIELYERELRKLIEEYS